MGLKTLHTASSLIGPIYAPDGSVLFDPDQGKPLVNASNISAYPLVLGIDVPHDTPAGVGAAPENGPFPWSGVTGEPDFAVTNSANTFTQNQVFSGLITPNGGIDGALGTAGSDGFGNPIGANLVLESTFQFGGAFWQGVGANGFQILCDENGPYIANSTLTNSTQSVGPVSFPCSPGQVVTTSAEFYSQGVTFSSGAGWQLDAQFRDANNNFLGEIITNINTSQGWTRISASGTAPANTATIWLFVRTWFSSTDTGSYASGAFLGVRKIKVELGSVATPYSQEGDVLAGYILRAVRALIDGTPLPGMTWTPTISGGQVTQATATGSVQGTCTYTYSGNQCTQAAVSLTWPWPFSYTETYSWSNGFATVTGGVITSTG